MLLEDKAKELIDTYGKELALRVVEEIVISLYRCLCYMNKLENSKMVFSEWKKIKEEIETHV